ncbi:Sodium- and chloride-dependent GABA transporter 1 [Gracilariopsis chorda]|uniref:Sodium-and chloride-dependent GABA transporter 1 n=1 Tax=Gracilariopsis chorda TaxID=448386 RepID=A0A2V3IIL6_9FLOR|nr:Sodium- and chloride-dependent GABA transporter 1 [Gracilariopsis chorda]|eukprot:PXF41888.1 Sodium- and chloride-dependent GABA transporter 1 [Gracilariopsis chorda]
MAHQRGKWSSRMAFIVASIGAAIGFGNVWRFPSLAYTYGGGAFFLPYLLALFIIGIPVLILEVAVGQFYQTGDAGAFGKVHPRFRGVGLSSIFAAFVVTTYYCVLLAWTLRMFVYSCQGSENRWKDVTGKQANDWFVGVVTGLSTAGDNIEPTRLVGPNVAGLAVTWIFIYLCLAFGVKWTGRIAYVTVGLPIAILIVLLVRAVTLDGSGDGVKAYIGEWDMKVLSDQPAVWSEAVTQVFFSLSVTFGIMTAYASYNNRNDPVFTNSIIIAISNSLYSIVAGFAVFGTIGYIAHKEGKTVDDFKDFSGGPSLIFATYPVALSTLPGHGHWERLFFIALFLLGIDSAFALAEGVTTVFRDSALLRRFHHAITTAGVCLVGFLGGLLFCTDSGLIFLDATDYYVNFMMILIGFMECFSIGWIYGIESQISTLGWMPVVAYMAATFGPVCLASGFWFGANSDEIMKGFVSLVVSYAVLMMGVFYLCYRVKQKSSEDITWRRILVELFMGNVLKLRKDLVGVVRYIPVLWFFMVRHLLPQLLLVLFANLATANNDDTRARRKFGHYSNYPRGYQALGITVFVLACVIIMVGMVFPRAYACFDRSTITENELSVEGEEVESAV